MKNEDIDSGLPERGRAGVNPEGRVDKLPPESEREVLANQRRLETSSKRSLRWAVILLGILALILLISWMTRTL